MAELFTNPARATDTDGNPLSGAKLFFYATGGTTPQDVYTTSALNVAHAHPVEADSGGLFPSIYLDPLLTYRAVCKDATEATTLYDIDPIATGLNASGVQFTQSGTGAVTATVQSKARQILNAADFTGFDATGVNDSATAIQAAINEAAARGYTDVMIPKGAKTGALTIPATVGLIGPNTKATLVAEPGTYTTITITGSDAVIKNLVIDEGGKSGSPTFVMACGTTGKDRLTIENVVTFSSWKLFEDSGTSNGVHTSTRMRDVQARAHRGPGLIMNRGFAFVELDHVVIDYVGVSASDFTGMSFSGAGLPAAAGGITLERCDVLGTAGIYTNPNQKGYVFTDMSAVTIRNSRADTCGSDGWTFDGLNGLLMDDVRGGLCDGHHFIFTDCSLVNGNKLTAFGRNYLTSPAANKDGIRFVSGNAGVVLSNILTRDHTGHGIHKVAAQTAGINLTGVSAFLNTGRGIKTVGDSGFISTGNQFQGNTAGNYDLGGAFDYLAANQLNSGAASSLIGPGPVTG